MTEDVESYRYHDNKRMSHVLVQRLDLYVSLSESSAKHMGNEGHSLSFTQMNADHLQHIRMVSSMLSILPSAFHFEGPAILYFFVETVTEICCFLCPLL